MKVMTNSEKCAIIKTEMLCKSYISDGEVNNVIKNMNLTIYEKDFTVIMGASGSGKSTLLYTLSGMLEATGGSIIFDRQDITSLRENKMALFRKKTLGFVFQSINLVNDLNLLENVCCPAYGTGKSKAETDARARELLERLEMGEQLKKFPHQLSGGQNQRVAICRALMNNPKMLFADEPTGALNSTQGQNVLDIFTELNENGQSIVMVTHDMKAALRANRLIYLKDGRLDGELNLVPYSANDIDEREGCVYDFLKKHGF